MSPAAGVHAWSEHRMGGDEAGSVKGWGPCNVSCTGAQLGACQKQACLAEAGLNVSDRWHFFFFKTELVSDLCEHMVV